MTALDRLNAQLAQRPLFVDSISAALFAAVALPTSVGLDQVVDRPAPLWSLLLIAPLALRRVRPVASAVAVFSVAFLQVVAGPWIIFPSDLAVLVSLYSVTVHGPRWAGRTAIASIGFGGAVFALRVVTGAGFSEGVAAGGGAAFVMAVMGLAVWAFALLGRSRRLRLDALRDRAAQLERERDQQHRLAAAAERARIAREMHDVVAHSLSVVVAQADGGRYVAEQDLDAARRALDTISETGRAALADMRRILGVLRAGSAAADAVEEGEATREGEPAPQLAPQPATAELEPLVEQVRAAGTNVSLVRLGTPRMLPPGLGLTIYRICQEALTNVLKHAGPDPTVTVLQQWRPEALILEVTDDGRGAAAESDGEGHGLLGMRERVALFGGTLAVGPRTGGGFRVRAEFPLPAGSEHSEPGTVGPPPSPPSPREHAP